MNSVAHGMLAVGYPMLTGAGTSPEVGVLVLGVVACWVAAAHWRVSAIISMAVSVAVSVACLVVLGLNWWQAALAQCGLLVVIGVVGHATRPRPEIIREPEDEDEEGERQ